MQENYIHSMSGCHLDREKAWFIDGNMNYLISEDMVTHSIQFVKKVFKKYNSKRRLYCGVVKKNEKIYLFPNGAEKMLVYNTETAETTEIDVDFQSNTHNKSGNSYFGWQEGNELYYFRRGYKSLYCMDTTNMAFFTIDYNKNSSLDDEWACYWNWRTEKYKDKVLLYSLIDKCFFIYDQENKKLISTMQHSETVDDYTVWGEKIVFINKKYELWIYDGTVCNMIADLMKYGYQKNNGLSLYVKDNQLYLIDRKTGSVGKVDLEAEFSMEKVREGNSDNEIVTIAIRQSNGFVQRKDGTLYCYNGTNHFQGIVQSNMENIPEEVYKFDMITECSEYTIKDLFKCVTLDKAE